MGTCRAEEYEHGTNLFEYSFSYTRKESKHESSPIYHLKFHLGIGKVFLGINEIYELLKDVF